VGGTADRPGSVKVQLYRNGEAHGSFEVLNNGNNWTKLWTELERGPTWTVDEVNVPEGYTKTITGDAVNGFTITNTKGTEPEYTSVKTKKVWADNDNPSRPASVTVQLYKDGQAHGSAVTLNTANEWEYTWTGLERRPTTPGGEPYAYTVDEINVPSGYTKTITGTATTGYTITNTKGSVPPSQIIIIGKKTWNHGSNPENMRPAYIVLLVKADGAVIMQKRISAEEDWAWSLTFPRYDGEREIVYTVDEADMPGYRKAVDGFNITNTYSPPGSTSVSVRKEWAGVDSPPGGSILVQLYRNGVPYGSAVTLNAANQWRYTWEGLDPNDPWTVDEFDVPEGYAKAIIGSTSEGFVITNTRDPNAPGKTIISGSKTWDHGNNPASKQPKFIDLRISANGKFILQVRVDAVDHWGWSIRMDKYDKDGREIVYTADEAPIENCAKSVYGYNLLNTYHPGTPGTPGKPSDPKTDDSNNLALWMSLMIASFAGLTVLIILSRRKRREEEKNIQRGLW